MSKIKPTYRVIRDTREQEGWYFSAQDECLGTVIRTLKTGDYSLEGFEEILSVERKRNMSELADNLTDPRFARELERLDLFRFPFLICEFTFNDIMSFPVGSGIPSYKWSKIKVKPRFLLKCINQILVKHRTKIIFAGDHGKEELQSLFKRVLENVDRPIVNQ